MPDPQHTAVSTFHRVAIDLAHEAFPDMAAALRGRIDRILKRWRRHSLKAMPYLDALTLEEFEDDVDVILSAAADALQSADPQKLLGVVEGSPAHGVERFVQEYSLLDFFEEVRILRGVVILELADKMNRPLDVPEAATFHAIFDIIIQQGVMALVQRQNERLNKQSEALAEESRRKDEFLAVLSHELRTPLSAVLGWSRVLQTKPDDPAVLEEGLGAIVSSSRALSRLVDDLLDHSRAVAGKLRLDLHEVEVAHAVEAAVESFRHSAEAKGVGLSACGSGARAFVMGDAERLAQIFWNLLSNAVKFTPPGGRVSVSSACEGSDVVVRVADTGEGISAEFLPLVFDPYTQDGAVSKRRPAGPGPGSGLGLGLSIAKRLVEMHGGTIRAESPGPERGSTFTIRLPIHASGGEGAVVAAQHEEAPNLAGISVLLVEDDLSTRSAMCHLLRRAGAEVTMAATVREAVQAFSAARPTVVVSDIGLADGNGYELLSEIRIMEAESGTPVPAIALTAYASDRDRTNAMAAGYSLHMAKPVDPERLCAAIREVVTD